MPYYFYYASIQCSFKNLCEILFYILGKDQVTVGVVPLDTKHRSSQSAKSVYPLAIANCEEKRFVSNH